MIVRQKSRLVAPLLAMSMALTLVASASAQNRYYDRQYQRSESPGVTLQINFGSTPRWSRVPGTQIREIRQGERTDYDIFQYGRSYYAYNHRNDRWYMSRRSRGQFRLIDDRSVPREFRRVPRNHWRNYPASWGGRNDQYDRGWDGSSRYDRGSDGSTRYDRGYDESSATLRVTFGSRPRWSGISGTRVATIPMEDRRDYDVFRYDNAYYAYDSNRWYRSYRESGEFTVIDDRDVPSELSRVPRDQWRSYPAAWRNNPNGMPPGQERKYRDRRGNGNY